MLDDFLHSSPLAPLDHQDPSVANDLIEKAIAALDRDVGVARSCLGELKGLIARKPGVEDFSHGGRIPAKGGLALWQMRRVEAFIEQNLSTALTLVELSDLAGLSPSHFSRSFKISTGHPPHFMIMRKRIELAQSLMLATRDSLGQIACDCGLSDQSHLTRLFRKFVGETPYGWRRHRQQATVRARTSGP